MGVNCKPVGKFKSTMKKMENQVEEKKRLAQGKRGQEKGKR